SPAGTNTWTNIAGANTMAYTASQNAATDYRCIVTCANSNSSQTSNAVSVGQNPYTQCFCTPIYTTGCNTYNLNSVVLQGEGTSILSDLNTGCNNTTATGYSDRSSLFTPVDLLQDQPYTVELNTTTTSALVRASIWIDFNDNGVFET